MAASPQRSFLDDTASAKEGRPFCALGIACPLNAELEDCAGRVYAPERSIKRLRQQSVAGRFISKD